MQAVNWGIIGTAKIAREKVIPALQRSRLCRVQAIASRNQTTARQVADQLGIADAYGSYEALLADPTIEAVYIPLPNHLHVPLARQAAEAGKHVLCEKPLALNASEAESLLEVRDRCGVQIMEAFMVRTHPQWLRTRELIRQGEIGTVRAVQVFFSYTNRDPDNVRNQADIGGGGLMDIGCYAITAARFCFEAEPVRVFGRLEYDPQMNIDRLTSAILDCPDGQATFTCSTQLVPYQRVHVFGEQGRIEIQTPFNAPADRTTRLFIDDGSQLGDASARSEDFDPVDQYTVQGDLFAEAIRTGKPQTLSLEDSVTGMRIIDALVRSGESGHWENP